MRTHTPLILILLAAAPALAQPAASTPSPRVKLDITREELNIIGQGLMELQYKTAAPVLNDLISQSRIAEPPMSVQPAPKAEDRGAAQGEPSAKP